MSPQEPSAGRARSRSASARLPLLLWLPAVVAVAFLAVPLLGLLVRAPWRDLPREVLDPAVRDALRLSLGCASAATALSVVLGVPLAWVLARSDIRGRRVLRALVMTPLVLPPVVGGVALLLVLGRNGVVGRHLHEWLGVSLPFTTAAVVVAETFVALPFLVLAVEGALRGADRRYEDAAATLGATPSVVFRRVTLPMALPGVAAGTLLCFARALGEFGATITFAGSFPGVTRTMPLEVYLALEADPERAVVLSLVLLAASAAVLFGLRDRWLSPTRPR